MILIAAVYFLQGLGGFATFTQNYYLRESYETSCPLCIDGSQPECDVEGCHAGLALSPGAQQALKATAGLPWNYKLFYGITSDCVPILGSNRRSYICLAGILGCIGFVGLGLLGNGADAGTVTALLFLTQLSTAFCDVCTDALVAANAKLESEEGAGNLQSLCWMSLGLGGMFSNLFAGPIFEALDSPSCFLLAAIVPFLRCFLSYRFKEPGAKSKVDFTLAKMQFKKVVKTLGHPGIHRPILFCFLAQATVPYVDMFNFLVDSDSNGWMATKADGSFYNTSEFGMAPGAFDCEWFAKNDPGCTGDGQQRLNGNAWFPKPVDGAAVMTRKIANKDFQISLPIGYDQTMMDTCADADGEMVAVASAEECLAVDGQTWNGCIMSSCDCQLSRPLDDGDVDDGSCSALSRQPIGGMSEDTLTEACPTLFALGGRGACIADVPRIDPPIKMSELCPKQCHGVVDMCGVAGGDGTSCAAQVMAEAWKNCPQACQTCGSNRRGCTHFTSTFMSRINIVAYAGLFMGSALYSAYCKKMKYRTLLAGAQILLAIFSATDYLLVSFVDPTNATVFGVDARWFAIFGEVINDVMSQVKLMPLLVLAAQICPASIEATLFAFIMQNLNTGGSYQNYWGSWIMDYFGISLFDFSGLANANLMRVFWKLSPLLYLFLVPEGNPKDIVEQIDSELNIEDDDDKLSDAPPAPKDAAPAKESPFSFPALGALALIAIMPLLITSMGLSITYYAVPVLGAIIVPTLEIHYGNKLGGPGGGSSAGTGALSEGLAGGGGGMDDKIQLGGAEPAAPPPTDYSSYSNPTPQSFDASGGGGAEPTGPPPGGAADITAL